MLHLAIECSGIVGSVALWESDLPLARLELPSHRSSIQTLAASLQQLLAQTHSTPDFLSVSSGPGSFTSLRVGLATAKMLAMAWNIPVVAVDSLAAIAYRQATELGLRTGDQGQKHEQRRIVVPVINAFRKQVFASAWMISGPDRENLAFKNSVFENPVFENLAQSQVVSASAWCAQPLESLQTASPTPKNANWQQLPFIISGPGLADYMPTGMGLTPSPPLADPSTWQPRAEEVAQLGWLGYQAGAAVSAAELTPNYVRASAAEEKLSSA